MNSTLKEGSLVKYPDNSVWYVDRVNASGAYIVPVSGYVTEIVTSKKTGRKRKMVIKYPRPIVISANAALEVLDPTTLNMSDVMRRVMARKDGVEGTATVESADGVKKPRDPREQAKYLRTNREAKEMKGQGRIVLDYLNGTTTPKTVSEITEQVKGGITTRQDPERVVGFYMSKFKRDGLVNVVGAEKKASAATA
jgi:hypothetical protein